MSKCIMTVDDSASIRQMVAFTLQEAGYEVIEAIDGEDALIKLKSVSVNMILADSAVIRQALKEILSSDSAIEVIGAARDPFIASDIMKKIVPDVIALDIEMPRMDGITFLQKIMRQHPIPVVICSGFSANNSETALKALEYGAAEIIQKPRLGIKQYLEESKIIICDAIKAAYQSSIPGIQKKTLKVEPKLTADVVIEKPSLRATIQTTDKIVVVGASTGGTETIRLFLTSLPLDAPGMVIVQHMPEHFTAAFARRLDEICSVSVKEAENDDTVMRGHVLIAPGNKHALLKRAGMRYYVEIKDGPLVSRHRPSVDVLFRSAARYAGKNAFGIIMTGMGDDGAKGILEMKEAGAYTIAQDEASCVVFGMPKEAIRLGAIDVVMPLEDIAGMVTQECRYKVAHR